VNALNCTWWYKTVHMSKAQFRQNISESCYKLNYFPNWQFRVVVMFCSFMTVTVLSIHMRRWVVKC